MEWATSVMPMEYPKRLSLPMTIAMKARMNSTIPSGVRAAFLRAVVDISLDSIEANGPNMLGMILHGSKWIKLIPRDHPKM